MQKVDSCEKHQKSSKFDVFSINDFIYGFNGFFKSGRKWKLAPNLNVNFPNFCVVWSLFAKLEVKLFVNFCSFLVAQRTTAKCKSIGVLPCFEYFQTEIDENRVFFTKFASCVLFKRHLEHLGDPSGSLKGRSLSRATARGATKAP